MDRKVKAAIIGPGNIGTDLLFKLERSRNLELIKMIGIYPESEGLRIAKEHGVMASSDGAEFLKENDGVQIVFDATSAKAHIADYKIISALGKYAIDLTPAAIGPYLVPAVASDKINLNTKNYNMVTCGGQATIPIVRAISRVQPVAYAEIVATLSSLSAGPGTRANIDEFTQTTSRAIEMVGGADKGKAIIILNPADPPLMMRDTIYAKVKNADQKKIEESIYEMVQEVKKYVPGYSMVVPPIFDEDRITVMVQVEGTGDYLPKYAGNLDIMTSAAVAAAETLADKLLA